MSPPQLLRFGSEGVLKIFPQRMTHPLSHLISNKGVYRTAPVTLGLLNKCIPYLMFNFPVGNWNCVHVAVEDSLPALHLPCLIHALATSILCPLELQPPEGPSGLLVAQLYQVEQVQSSQRLVCHRSDLFHTYLRLCQRHGVKHFIVII